MAMVLTQTDQVRDDSYAGSKSQSYAHTCRGCASNPQGLLRVYYGTVMLVPSESFVGCWHVQQLLQRIHDLLISWTSANQSLVEHDSVEAAAAALLSRVQALPT